MKVAGPPNIVSDLGSHVGECFREFPGAGAGAAQMGISFQVLIAAWYSAEWVVPAASWSNCRSSCHVQARLQADQTGRKFGYQAVLFAMVRLTASGASPIGTCCCASIPNG